MPEKIKHIPAAPARLSTLVLAAAVVMMVFTASSCRGGEVRAPASVGKTTATRTEDIQVRPPPPPPGRAPDPATTTAAVDDTLQLQLESLLSTYSLEYQYSVIAELAADKYHGRKTGSEGARAAATFIAGEYKRLGLLPWTAIGLDSYYHHFVAGDLEDDNVIGVLPGNDPDGEIVVLAAHYDHLGLDMNGAVFNGADDNAAGVATVLEAAAVLQTLGYQPVDTIIFCAFSGEEQGQYGASALGRSISGAGLADRVEVINIDGIGATGGDYLGVWDEGSAAAAPLVELMSQAGAYLSTNVINEGTDIGSDAQPLAWEYGIPAITFDWDWGSDPSPFHPHYHTIHDDAAAIDRPTLARATRVILVGLWLSVSR